MTHKYIEIPNPFSHLGGFSSDYMRLKAYVFGGFIVLFCVIIVCAIWYQIRREQMSVERDISRLKVLAAYKLRREEIKARLFEKRGK